MNREISVLVVDDERSVADLAAVHLERLHDGMTVEIETAAAAALARFERDPDLVDCIVSDHNMPGMGGLEFLAAVRRSDPDVPFVLFTGRGSEEIASEAVSAGVTDYLQKGTGIEQYELLANRVENAVEAHRAEERVTQLARINAVVAAVQRELVRQSTREAIESRVCASLAGAEPYTLAWIGVPDDGGFAIHERAGHGTEYLDTVSIRTDDTPRGRGPVGRVLATGEPQVVRDVTKDVAFGPWDEAVDHHDFGSVIALPLSYDAPSSDEASYGVLGVYSADRYAFGDDERDALTELAGTVAHAIHAAETRTRLEHRERALAESERKYRSLIDAAPDAVFVADADTHEIVETNAAAEALLDRDRETILGLTQSELHPSGETGRYHELFEKRISGDPERTVSAPSSSPMSVVRADGEHVPVEISASVVEVGDRTLIHGLFRDVSAREEHQRELREERAVTESLFDATPDPIYAFDADGAMLRWNETFESVVGYSTEEIADMNCLEFIPPADHALIRDRIEAVVAGGETVTVESAFVTKSGETIPHEFSGAPLAVGNLRGTVGTGRDVTDRKAREREREQYQTAIETVDDAVYVLDDEGRFEFVNEAFGDLTGYDPEEVLGNGVGLIKDDETVRLFEDLLRGMLSAGTEETTVEFEIRTAADERIPCEDHLAVRMVDGEFHGVAGAIRDISDRRDREAIIAALHTATRDLVRAEDRRGVANVTAAATEEVLGFPLAVARLYDPETDTLEPTATTDTVVECYGQRPTYARGEGLPWRAFESGGPAVASAEAVNYRTIEFENALYVPIGDHGILSIVSQDREFEDAEIELARVLAANAATALDRLEREGQLRRYKRMLDTAGDSIYALDAEGRFTAVNDTAVSVSGYSREEVIGEHVSSILGPEAFELGTSVIRRLLSADRSDATDSYEFEARTATGEVFPCDCRITLLRSDGEFEGTVGVIRDISEKKRNETYRRKLYEATSSSGMTFDERIERMLRLGCEYLGTDVGFLTRIEGDTLRVVAARGAHDVIQPGAECPLSEAYCRRTVEADGPFAVHDAVTVGWEGDPARELFGLDSYIGGKVTVDNEVYGTFCFADGVSRETFTNAEVGFVDLVARGAGRELERREHERALSALHDATREMVAATDRDEVAEIAVETVERVLDIPLIGFWRYDTTDEVLRPLAFSERGETVVEKHPTYADDGSLSWEAFVTGEPHNYDRIDREANVYNSDTPIRSEMILPVGGYGVMNVGAVEPRAFTDRDFSLAKLLAANTETALDRAEREHLLRQRQRELETERDRLTALFENVTDAALSYEVVDGQPIAERVNARFEEVFGYPTDEIIGENVDDYIVPDGREEEAASYNKALVVGESLQVTVRRRTAGGLRDFLLHVIPLDPGEQNAGGYTLYTDITDQKRRERELERQNHLLDEFASVISHDLRNPMSVARGRIELAEMDTPSEHHDDALWALDRMDTLIEDVLTLAREGRVIGDTERVAIPSVAERAWRTAGTGTASLTVEDPGALEADPDRLTRLFENLFRNAVEHAGAETAVVVGPLEAEGAGFFVEDDGPGIPEGEREAVFEGGYSTTESGSGLGLMIVRSIAEAHGWEVRATRCDRGARFEVSV